MTLELRNVSKRVGVEEHIRDVSLTLEKGSLNVLLGPTLSGKTSLMRLMAGLDRPSAGDVLVDGKSVVGLPVQKRSVAMVSAFTRTSPRRCGWRGPTRPQSTRRCAPLPNC